MFQSRFLVRSALIVLVIAAVVVGKSIVQFNLSRDAFAESPSNRTAGDLMRVASEEFLSTLNDDQRSTTVYKFGAKERTGWHFIPKDSRKGFQFKNMNDKQRAAAKKLLAACLSHSGFEKATTIMKLEGLLNAIEKGRGAIRDPERYYYTVFGQPGKTGKWGLSIEGHHLSLNFVVEDNKLVSVSPSFFAANPGTVKTEIYDQVKKGTRVLKDEEELGFKLVNSLTEDQKKKAIFAAKAPKEIRGAGEAQPPKAADNGIAVSDLNDDQIMTLKKLVSCYSSNFPASVEKEKLAAIEESGWKNVKFGWGGATKPGIGHYYRIRGTTFLIEFVNTQPDAQGNPANHIHCVWRNPNGDFAIELKK